MDLDNRTIMSLFPTTVLDSDTDYEVTIKAGLKDKYGNTSTEDVVYTFRTEAISNTPVIIDSFETGIDTNWWEPQQSGSTIGIITDSTSRTAESFIVSGFNNSTKSMKVRYGFDSGASDHLIRQYLGGGSPLNWYGWRLVKWDMSKDAVAWVGAANGVVEGSSKFDSFQFSYTPNNPRFAGTIYIDDFAYSSITVVSTENDTFKPNKQLLNKIFQIHLIQVQLFHLVLQNQIMPF